MEDIAFEDSFKDTNLSVLNMSISNIITMSKIRIVLLNFFYQLDQQPFLFRSGIRLLISYFILFKSMLPESTREFISKELDDFRAQVYRTNFNEIEGSQFEVLDKRFMYLFELITKAADNVGLGFLKEKQITEKNFEDLVVSA